MTEQRRVRSELRGLLHGLQEDINENPDLTPDITGSRIRFLWEEGQTKSFGYRKKIE